MFWLKIIKSLVGLRGKDKTRRIIGLISIAICRGLYAYSGDNVSLDTVSQHTELLVSGGYGLYQLIVGTVDRKKGK